MAACEVNIILTIIFNVTNRVRRHNRVRRQFDLWTYRSYMCSIRRFITSKYQKLILPSKSERTQLNPMRAEYLRWKYNEFESTVR